jgi:hypothetical protein
MTLSESKQLKADYQARFGNYEIQVSTRQGFVKVVTSPAATQTPPLMATSNSPT